MQAEEPVFAGLSTLSSLVRTCYEFYQNNKLNEGNANTAKALADRLRDISVSVSEAENSDHTQETSKILKKISNDVQLISGHVSKVQKQVNAALSDAPSIETELRDALTLALVCQSRLETVQLFIARARKNDKFFTEWDMFYKEFEQVHNSRNVDETIANAFRTLNLATRTLVPASHVTEGSSVTTASSIHPDDAEDESVRSLERVPAAVKDLVILASQDRIGSTRLRSIVEEFLTRWDGWYIHYNDIKYDCIQSQPVMLGSGGFGKVFAGKLIRRHSEGVSEHRVAVKQIQIGDDQASTVLAEIMREALLHMILKHHCILPCLGVSLPASVGSVTKIKEILNGKDTSEEALTASILTERMSCNLDDALKGKKSGMRISSVEDKLKIVTDISKAVCFLHTNNIVHRDIKPENVLLNFEHGQLKGYAKLADFGNSRRAHVQQQSKKFSSTISKVQGIPLFMPPERLLDVEGCRTTKAWDIWSYGVLLCFVFAYEEMPRFNSSEVRMFAHDRTLAGRMKSWAESIPLENIKSIARQCLDCSPERRIEEDPISIFSTLITKGNCLTAEDIFQRALKYMNGSGVERDEARAAHLYKKAADIGCADAMFHLGLCYDHGKGVEKNEAQAAHLYKKAADLGSADAMFNLGLCYDHGTGVEMNEARAAHLYKKAVELGDTAAMINLGLCYKHGRGVEKNEVHAAHLYKKAADLGRTEAMFNLGLCYMHGTGVKMNEARAAQLYKQAADLGHADAIFNLGLCYMHGRGVDMDEAQAAHRYKQAVDLGEAAAMINLGLCYMHGRGVEKDEACAARLYKEAADIGDAVAMVNLGLCYEHGRGVEKDEAPAAHLYKQAAALGDARAIRFLRDAQ